jgi:hypothetical protein
MMHDGLEKEYKRTIIESLQVIRNLLPVKRLVSRDGLERENGRVDDLAFTSEALATFFLLLVEPVEVASREAERRKSFPSVLKRKSASRQVGRGMREDEHGKASEKRPTDQVCEQAGPVERLSGDGRD